MFAATRALFSGLVDKPIKQSHTWRMGQKKRKNMMKGVESFLRLHNTCYSRNLPKPRQWTEKDILQPMYKQDHLSLLEKYGYGNKMYKTMQKYEGK
ncbi:hypothetical protein SAMD00019534_116270 [Acytostelium subglobosum LB1]|uniref:hypothetical protein n=1 Tax=Acytostelium subglobosum LB1 TaxID=1410327 RepID=UPI0006447B24|nr:hypothetical protein SAMD00019534_116270 [Acytostelium subglobosum LB1]GAM28451.1 hypothetical protein SAMD00019534_116270 [Acytostelium subglobosum LB1]|eukprot:XP_012748490.1 hypothetical protein SAMD00019534_116270 [Acytostelium subglobosum LB1]